MNPITPLGKPLSQNSLAGSEAPLQGPPLAAGEQPISAFQWISLAKATWTWILRPLWYLCFKWPAQLVLLGMAPASKSNEGSGWDWRKEHARREGQKMAEAMARDMRQDR